MGEDKTNPDFEFLGLKIYWPNNIWRLVGFTIIIGCLTAISIVALVYHYNISSTKDGWSFGCGKITDDDAKLKRGVIIGFWTPSDSTESGLNINKFDSAKYSWQMSSWQKKNGSRVTIETMNVQFADFINRRLGFKGYRRYKVVGEGSTKLKEGYWWEVGYEGRCDEQLLKDFKKTYIEFWNPDAIGKPWDNVYVEVIGNTKQD